MLVSTTAACSRFETKKNKKKIPSPGFRVASLMSHVQSCPGFSCTGFWLSVVWYLIGLMVYCNQPKHVWHKHKQNTISWQKQYRYKPESCVQCIIELFTFLWYIYIICIYLILYWIIIKQNMNNNNNTNNNN